MKAGLQISVVYTDEHLIELRVAAANGVFAGQVGDARHGSFRLSARARGGGRCAASDAAGPATRENTTGGES